MRRATWATWLIVAAACRPAASGDPAAPTTSEAAERVPPADAAESRPAPRPPSPLASPVTTASGSVTTLATVPTMGAVVIGPRVVVLSADFHHVTGIDITTGSEIWRRALPDEPRGQHILMRLGERALLRRAEDLILIEPGTGRIAAHHRRPMSDRQFLHRRRGMCLINGRCSVQLIDCEDARPIGKPVRGQMIHMHEWSVDGDSRMESLECMFDFQMIGRADDRLIYSASGAEPPPKRGARRRGKGRLPRHDVLAARDATTGKILWSHDGRHCGSCSEADSGVSPDGKVAWLSRGNLLERFDPRTGAAQWQVSFTDDIESALWVEPTGLFVRTKSEIALVMPGGRLRFRKPHPDPKVLPLLRRALLPEFANIQLVDEQERLAWLDEATGEVTETVALEGKTLLGDRDGHPQLHAHDDDRDAGGQVIEGARQARLEVLRGRSGASGPPDQAVLRERATGAELLTIDRDAWLLGEWHGPDGSSNEVQAALFVHGADREEAAEVRVIRFEPAIRTQR